MGSVRIWHVYSKDREMRKNIMSSTEKVDFDRYAQDYHGIKDGTLRTSGFSADYFAMQKARITVEEAPLPDPGVSLRLLDVGCGTGMLEALIPGEMARKAGTVAGGATNIRMDGIDVSGKSVEEARALQLPVAFFQEYDGQHIPFADETFHVIVFSCVLHHVLPKIREPLLRECRRVLKPRGALLIFEHNPLNPLAQLIVKRCPFDGDAILLFSGEAAELLRRTGFRVMKRHFINVFPNWGLFRMLMPMEKWLSLLPLGAQYYLRATRVD